MSSDRVLVRIVRLLDDQELRYGRVCAEHELDGVIAEEQMLPGSLYSFEIVEEADR